MILKTITYIDVIRVKLVSVTLLILNMSYLNLCLTAFLVFGLFLLGSLIPSHPVVFFIIAYFLTSIFFKII